MSDYREEHAGAVYAAIDAIGRLQELLAVATEQCDVAVGTIVSSTGSTEVESARNALETMSGCKEKIEEVFGMSIEAIDDLRKYAGGF